VTSSRSLAFVACVLIGLTLGACGQRPDPPMPSSLVGRLRGHTNTITTMAVSSDGRRLVSSSRDGTLRVWDAATGAPEATLTRGW